MASHDVVRDAFTIIMRNARFHVLRKQTHVLLSHTLQSLRCQVNIVLSIDGVRTLANVVIIDPIRVDLASRIVLSHGIVVTVVAQAKDGFYRDRFPTNMFLLLAIEVFECLHQQMNVPTWHGQQKAL
jgi:hypothetical protein